MRSLLNLLYALSCLSVAATAQVHEFKLDNGLRLLVKEDHRAPIVVSQVWYKVGASYEIEGKTGLSHILEHMMFKGTQKHPPGEFSRIMSANGASENAFTANDYTAYFQTIEKSRLPISFELEADRMRNLVLQEAEFIKERNVVAEERRSRTEDDPDSNFMEIFDATAYQNNPYRRPVIGWMNDIQNFQLADLQAWYQRWYAPNNAIVVVAGDVNPTEVFELAKKYFGELKPSDIIPSPATPEPTQLGQKRLTVKLPAKVAQIIIGYKVPSLLAIDPAQTAEVYALDILQNLLSGDGGRLNKNLVRGQQLASSAFAGYGLYDRLDNLFLLAATPTSEHTVAELETALLQEVEKLKTTLVDDEELARLKVQVKATHVYERDSLFYQAMKIGTAESVGLKWQDVETYLDKISAVTPQQIQAVAQKYLTTDHQTIGILDPQPVSPGQMKSVKSHGH